MGIQSLLLESDAKALVEVVNATELDDSYRGQIVADIRFSLNFFPRWQMVYASRQVDRVAHALAQHLHMVIWTMYGGVTLQFVFV